MLKKHYANTFFLSLCILNCVFTGYPSPNHPLYPMPQPGGHSMPPYPVGGYGDPGQNAPPAGFQVGYQPVPDQPIMYQPGPVSPAPQPGQPYGGKPIYTTF